MEVVGKVSVTSCLGFLFPIKNEYKRFSFTFHAKQVEYAQNLTADIVCLLPLPSR